VLDAPASKTDVFLWTDTFFSSNELKLHIWNKMSLSPLKTLISRKYSFQKPTQFSQGNNVLDAPACKKDVFL
jgi:hypothetical protein